MLEEIRARQMAAVLERRKNAKKRRHILVVALLLIFFVIFVTVQFIGNYSFEVTHYSLNSNKLEIPIRIAALSDLHSKEYGEENEKLVETIKNEHPDMIVMLGDMVNKDDADISVIRTLCRQLKEIAPVYYSMGNHEGTMMTTRTDSIDINRILKEDGVHVLYNQTEDFEKDGTVIHLAGISTSYNNYDQWSKEPLKDFWDLDGYKILLSHYPALYYEKLKDAKVDLALAGHYHGGVVRIPGLGGLYHPEEGFFPKYSGGKYSLTYGTLIVSRGLGDHGFALRINNRPELVIIDINKR